MPQSPIVAERNMKTDSRRYFAKLASLRFFAALLVIFSHMRLSENTHNPFIKYIDGNVFWSGFIGVSVFYVLSGFVISYANDNWGGWKKYLIGRIARIYPAHLIVTVLIILVFRQGIAHWNDLLVWASNFALLQAWVYSPRYFFSLNDVAWSLSVEVFFYLTFIFLRSLEDRYIYLLCICGYCFNLAFEAVDRNEPVQWVHWFFYINPVARFPEFLMGMSVYRLYKHDPSRSPWFAQADFVLVFLFLIATISALHILDFNTIYLYSSVPALFSMLMLMTLVFGKSSGYMNSKALIILGESSFALYLIHKPLYRMARLLMKTEHFDHYLLVIPLTGLLAIGLSLLFYLKVELKATRAVKGYLLARFMRTQPAVQDTI